MTLISRIGFRLSRATSSEGFLPSQASGVGNSKASASVPIVKHRMNANASRARSPYP